MSYQSIPDFSEHEDVQVLDVPASLKAQCFRRIPIFVVVLLFLTAVTGSTRHSPTTSSMTSFATSTPEHQSRCLSRDYGPVKEGYDLVSNMEYHGFLIDSNATTCNQNLRGNVLQL
jgi:hypothetical protein